MGRKPQVQARIPEDTYEQVEQYIEEHNISQSDAVRRALEEQYGTRSVARQRMPSPAQIAQIVTTGIAAFIGAAAI